MGVPVEVPKDVYDRLRAVADAERRDVNVLISEALSDLLAKRAQAPRPRVMSAYAESVKAHDTLYQKLAK